MAMRAAMSCLSIYAGMRGRRAALRAAKEKLARERAERARREGGKAQGVELVFDPEAIVARVQGREGWLRDARRQLEEHRRLAGAGDPALARASAFWKAEHRLQENLRVEREANEAYEHHRAIAVSKDGRTPGRARTPMWRRRFRGGRSNVTDLDSRNVKTPRSYTQGYNVQAVVNEQQIVLAAEVTLARSPASASSSR